MARSTNTDFTKTAIEVKVAEYRFHLSPNLWDRYQGPQDLEWTCVRYARESLAAIPDTAGVYAFCVRPLVGGNLCGSYLLYIGKTTSLKRRCGEYLRRGESGRERPRIQLMLNLFSDTRYLRYCFVEVLAREPREVERALLVACVPPACTDIPGDVGRAVRAFGGS